MTSAAWPQVEAAGNACGGSSGGSETWWSGLPGRVLQSCEALVWGLEVPMLGAVDLGWAQAQECPGGWYSIALGPISLSGNNVKSEVV